MTGVEVMAGVAVGYLVRKLRRVGGRLDTEVDQAVDAGLDALHELVSGTLGDDPALAALREQAPVGVESERVVRRVTDAIADAADNDAGFAGRLQELVEDLQRREVTGGAVIASGAGAIAVGGDQSGITSTGDGAINFQQR